MWYPTTVFEVALALALLFVALQVFYYVRAKLHMTSLPDKGLFWFVGNTASGKLFEEMDKIKDPIFLSWMGSTAVVFVHDPALAKEVLRNTEDFVKDASYRLAKGSENHRVLDGSLFSLDGEAWSMLAKKMSPSFHFSSIKRMSPVFVDLGHKMLDLLEVERSRHPTSPIDVSTWLRKYTLDVLGRALLGVGFDSLEGKHSDVLEAYHIVLANLLNPLRSMNPWLDWLTFLPFVKKGIRARHTLFNFFRSIAAERRSSKRDGDAPSDLLDALLDAYDEGLLSDDHLMSNMLTVYIAGHDTTSSALGWGLYHLCKHPEMQERMYQEVTEVLQGRDPQYDDIASMPFVNNFINEVLRYSSVVSSLITRSAARDTQIGGHSIAKYSMVTINICSIHHDERNYEDAMTFDPDRFSSERKKQAGKKHPYTFLPFSLGPRQCTGAKFSTTEQALVLAMFLQRFKITLPDESKVTRDEKNPMLNNLTCLPVMLHPRASRA